MNDLILKANVEKAGHPDSVMALRWCLSESLRRRIDEEAITDLFVAIIVHGGRKEKRYLVPLSQKMTYIQFVQPGVNRVFATLVSGSERVVSGDFLERTGKSYDGSFLAYDFYNGSDERLQDPVVSWNQSIMNGTIVNNPCPPENRPLEWIAVWLGVTCSLTFDVPKEVFAKPPPRWVTLWNNKLFKRSKAVDQCDMRRRVLATSPLLALYLLLAPVYRLLAYLLIAGIAGQRGMKPAAIVRPLKYSEGDFYGSPEFDSSNSIYTADKNRNHYKGVRKFLYPAISPGGITFITLTGVIFYDLGVAILAAPLTALLFATPIVLLLGALVTVVSVMERKARAAEVTGAALSSQELDYLTCDTINDLPVEIDSLAKRDRTIKLRYLDTKAKVCKPYAG